MCIASHVPCPRPKFLRADTACASRASCPRGMGCADAASTQWLGKAPARSTIACLYCGRRYDG